MGKKATVIIDVQNDFVTGSLGSEWAQRVEPLIVKHVKSRREAGDLLYATRDTHFVDPVVINGKSKVEYSKTLEGKLLPVPHCDYETRGWQNTPDLLDALEGSGCTFVDKPSFGSYDLVCVIREGIEKHGIDSLELCGFCTSICVLANAVLLRAAFPNMEIRVLSGLCADVTREAHDAALAVLKAQQIEVA